MCLEAATLTERLSTVLAQKGSFTRVTTSMAVEIAWVLEGTRAEFALEWTFTRVDAGVDAHVATTAAAVATLIALQRTTRCLVIIYIPGPRQWQNLEN